MHYDEGTESVYIALTNGKIIRYSWIFINKFTKLLPWNQQSFGSIIKIKIIDAKIKREEENHWKFESWKVLIEAMW